MSATCILISSLLPSQAPKSERQDTPKPPDPRVVELRKKKLSEKEFHAELKKIYDEDQKKEIRRTYEDYRGTYATVAPSVADLDKFKAKQIAEGLRERLVKTDFQPPERKPVFEGFLRKFPEWRVGRWATRVSVVEQTPSGALLTCKTIISMQRNDGTMLAKSRFGMYDIYRWSSRTRAYDHVRSYADPESKVSIEILGSRPGLDPKTLKPKAAGEQNG